MKRGDAPMASLKPILSVADVDAAALDFDPPALA